MSDEMKKSIPTEGVDAVNGLQDDSGDSNQAENPNHKHIEDFMNDLSVPDEVQHAVNHGQKKLNEHHAKSIEGKDTITYDDYKKLKSEPR